MIKSIMYFSNKDETVKLSVSRDIPCKEITGILFNGKKYRKVETDNSIADFCYTKIYRAGYKFDTLVCILSHKECESLSLIESDEFKQSSTLNCEDIAFPLVLGYTTNQDKKILCVTRKDKKKIKTVFFVQQSMYEPIYEDKEFAYRNFEKTTADLSMYDWSFFKNLENVVKNALLYFSCNKLCK